MSTVTRSQKSNLFSALQNLTEEIPAVKQAAAKAAEAPTPADPGGYQGPTTHETANIDNRAQAASEGSRSAENESDVKKDQGVNAVDNTPENQPGNQDKAQLNIGTQQSATGEDPSVENDFKGGKDDPGSTHDARTDNDALDGHKYANLSVGESHGLFSQMANGILADIANGSSIKRSAHKENEGNLNPTDTGGSGMINPVKQMSGEAPGNATVGDTGMSTKEEKAAGDQTNDEPEQTIGKLDEAIKKASAAIAAGSAANGADINSDLQAGYELAAVLGVEKQAAQEFVASQIESTINDANFDAHLLGSYLQEFNKQAMEGASEDDGENHTEDGSDTSGANGAEGVGGETEGGPAAGGEGGMPEMGGLGDMLGGGGDPGGMAAGPEPGSEPGPEPGMEGGGMEGGIGGGMGEEEALMQLVAALDELGIPLEELAQAGGGMPGPEGGMPPEAGGMPPEAGPMPGAEAGGMPAPGADPMLGEGMKLASAVKAFRRSGKYQFKEANNGSQERQVRDEMKNYVIELMRSK